MNTIVIPSVPKTWDLCRPSKWFFDYQGLYGVGYSALYTINAPFSRTLNATLPAPEAENFPKHCKISEIVTGQA